MSGPRRVVITGLGTLNPLGNSVAQTWSNAIEGKSGLGLITRFDTTDCPVRVAAEVKDFDPTAMIGKFQPFTKKDLKRAGRFIHLGVAAGIQAYIDSGLETARDQLDPLRMGVNLGSGMGGLPEIEEVQNDFLAKGYKRITPFFIPQCIPNMAAGHLSIAVNFQGPNYCAVSACASSAHAIGESYKQIQAGVIDVALAGGTEATICKLGIGGFAAMRALSTFDSDPAQASRPWDASRDGFVMGEGSAVMVLEEYEMAKKRGATIYGEIVGYAATSDAYHITSPSPDGEGGRKAMELSLKDARLNAGDIGYVNAHATSTPLGDIEESRAIAKLFENHKKNVHVGSTKSMTGHLLGAAGAIEGMFSALALRDQIIPPTINLDKLDPECEKTGLNFTPKTAVKKAMKYSLSNSFGFGGTNVSLIFGKI